MRRVRPEAVSLPLPPGPPADQGALGSSTAHAFVTAREMLARRGQDRGIYPRDAEGILRDERRPKPILWYCPECGVGPQPGEEGTVICAHCGQEHQLAIAEAKAAGEGGGMKKRRGPGGDYGTGWHIHRGLWGTKEEEPRARDPDDEAILYGDVSVGAPIYDREGNLLGHVERAEFFPGVGGRRRAPWFWIALFCLLTVMFWAGYYLGVSTTERILQIAPIEVGP